ncbi:Cohesin subunit psc3 [Grifola frondosa]|uniref:Cohesin subunit psc3 n=1 Tax=Grifola frondosa TaxID=5627 RepID=A0A1C7MGQ1_GRIFR|nr:Cohesin subunit psc3 [Grifola frondosa]
MNPAAALQSTAEDFLESLSQTPGPSQAELINCILRSCGCNDSVDQDEVVDYDGVVDALDNFTEVLKKDDSPVYPLTSKLQAFKKFRRSLSEFLERLIISSAELGSLYTSDLMATLQTWVVAMSSSQLRSFRHTATVIALEVETALCDVAAAVEKEAEVVSRQREGERKRRAAGNKGKAGTAREKELEGKAAEVRERRTKLAEFLKEFVDGVFVHRYRDLDPSIRAECVRAMGLWFKKYPAHFLDGAYLRYVGWVLSDAHTHVRLEAVRALALAYEQTAYIGAAALQHFTERFKPRLVEMAVGDTELSVRVAVVQVLQAIDSHGLLEDEQRERLCLLVFDEEARVRKAVSGFVKGVWEESVEERLVGRKATDMEKSRVGVKALGMLLVNWGKALDKTSGNNDGDDEDDVGLGKEVASLVGPNPKGRTALAVEALWDEVEPVNDWENLLDVLLLDHSAVDEASSSQARSGRSKGKQTAADAAVDEAWRLEEVEEAVLLEMLVAILRKAITDAASAKKGEDETVSSDITRALIKGLPGLFVKHQTDENRIADVLLIPQLMNLDMYLEMRMMTAYSTLWEDITKQFLSHSSPVVLTNAAATIRHMMDATSLSNTNSTKILELEDELSTSLRDAIAGRDEVEVASFSEDEVLSLGAICARLAALSGIRNLTTWMEEDEGGKQSSAWDIISALAERGRLGYKEEEIMIDRALHVLTLHIMWKARGLPADVQLSPEEARFLDKLREERDSLLEKLTEFAVGTQSNTVEGVRRAAFQNLMTLHILFCPAESIAPDGSRLPTASLPLTLEDEVQYRCAGFVQAEVERYAEELAETSGGETSSSEDEDVSDGEHTDDEGRTKGKKAHAGKGKHPTSTGSAGTSRSQLEKEYTMIGVVTTFLRAIRAGVIHFRHAAILLAHYGRLGPAFDLCSKVIVDILREEGMYKNNGEAVVAVICQALRESFTLVLDGMVRGEEHSVALAKTLAACLMIRGAQLSVVRRLDSRYVVDIHTTCLTWIGKRLAAYENAKVKKARNKCILFFRALLPLLGTIDNRDSLVIKAHLDQVMAQAKLEVSPTAKPWEPCRAYEKRLATAMTRDKASNARKKKAQKNGVKSTELVTTDDDEGDMREAEDRPRRVLRAKGQTAVQGNESGTDAEPEATGDEDNVFGSAPLHVQTPKARPRPNPAFKGKTPVKPHTQSDIRSPERSPVASPTSSPIHAALVSSNGLTTPLVSRKRARSENSELSGDEQRDAGDAVEDDQQSVPDSPSALPASQVTQASEIQIRRKRVRH